MHLKTVKWCCYIRLWGWPACEFMKRNYAQSFYLKQDKNEVFVREQAGGYLTEMAPGDITLPPGQIQHSLSITTLYKTVYSSLISDQKIFDPPLPLGGRYRVIPILTLYMGQNRFLALVTKYLIEKNIFLSTFVRFEVLWPQEKQFWKILKFRKLCTKYGIFGAGGQTFFGQKLGLGRPLKWAISWLDPWLSMGRDWLSDSRTDC